GDDRRQLLQSSQLVQPGYGYHRRFKPGCNPERGWRNERFHGRSGRGPAVPYGPSPPVLTFKLFLEGSRIPRALLVARERRSRGSNTVHHLLEHGDERFIHAIPVPAAT